MYKKYVNLLLGTVRGNQPYKKCLLEPYLEDTIHKAIKICGQKPSWIVLKGTILLLKLEWNLITPPV